MFDKSVVTERTLSTGSIIRVKIEPVKTTTGQRQVRILEYYRKALHKDKFKRDRQQEGQIVRFEDLHLPESYEQLFG